MCKVIAICNQKGGVSKTTTTANLGVGLVRAGKEVLVIDADPQGNLSQSLGIENPDELEVALPSIMEQIIMDKEVDVTKGIIRHKEGLDFMPSLGMITVNSLTASDSVLIPVQAAYLPVKELEQLIMRIIHSKSLFYWLILKVFDIQMVNSLFVYETVG